MSEFAEEIIGTLRNAGLECRLSEGTLLSIVCRCARSGKEIRIAPLDVCARTLEEALAQQALASEAILGWQGKDGEYPLVVTSDRWRRSNGMMKARLLSHVELHRSIFARDCTVRRIDKITAREFLERCHSYGYASGKHHLGLFVARSRKELTEGELVAVATFSSARKWLKGGKEIHSFEWTRYSSLPSVRVTGGMGKILKAFIEEKNPDDIMSYADLEWSEGKVYEQLGFVCEGVKAPVSFEVNPQDWSRKAIGKTSPEAIPSEEKLYFTNFGSRKYRLKLTEY